MKKVILAYSGGLDTSVICKWLALKGYQIICYVADVGQKNDFKNIKKKAISSGAKKVIVENLQKEFAEKFILTALGFNAKYENRYLLGTSLARPLITQGLIKCAKKEKANFIAHGATGKGNDQVRFEISAYALNSKIKIIAPWRIKEFYSLIKGRKEAINFAKKNKIKIKASLKEPWSSDDNIFHISFEGGSLEDPLNKPTEKMFKYSKSVLKAKNSITKLTIEFKKGLPIKLNNKRMSLLEIIKTLNKIGYENGIGRIDIVESRFLGIKSRGVYETPGGTILYHSHIDIESLTLSRELIRLKNSLMLRFSDLVYNGYWYSEEMKCLLSFLNESQKNVEGIVKLELYKGNIITTGRTSKKSLYNIKISSMEDDQGIFNIEDATGFIKINSLNLIQENIISKKN